MKKSYKLALLAVLGLATVTAAHAGTTDMLLGFDDAAAPTLAGQSDYVIDLGAQTLFTTTASLNLSSDFSASTFNTAFGSDGNSLNDVAVGAVAGSAPTTGTHTLFQTSTSLSGLATWTTANLAAFNGAIGYAQSPAPGEYASGLGLGGNPTTSGGFSQYVAIDPNTPGGNAGGSVASTSGNPLQFLSSGIVSEELFESTGTGARGSSGSAWTEIGTFDINVNSDTVSFTGVDAVPEPATYGLLAASGLLIVALRRQFKAKNA